MRYIGIDGGGTKTALCLLENGKVTARAVCGPLNYRTAKTDALRNLKEGLDLLLAQSPGPVRAAGLGDPALDECGRENDKARPGCSAVPCISAATPIWRCMPERWVRPGASA